MGKGDQSKRVGNPERFEYLRAEPRQRISLLKALRRKERLGMLTAAERQDLEDLQHFHNDARLDAVAGDPLRRAEIRTQIAKYDVKDKPGPPRPRRPIPKGFISVVPGGLPSSGKR